MTSPSTETLFQIPDIASAGRAEKDTMLNYLIGGIATGNKPAIHTAQAIGRSMLKTKTSTYAVLGDRYYDGMLSPEFTIDELLCDTRRLQGYLKAIERWDNPELIMDVGTGAFAILALAAAVYHPNTPVQALELEPQSAQVAEDVVKLFGKSDQVEVLEGDVGTHQFNSGLTHAVTETFSNALASEPGPQIIRLLAVNGIPYITPSMAELRIRLGKTNYNQMVNLRTDETATINISAESYVPRDKRQRDFGITTSFLDEQGTFLVHNASSITRPLNIRDLGVQLLVAAENGHDAVLSYQLGDKFNPQWMIL